MHFYGNHTRGEFEHAEVSVFVGKNPWMSQSFPRARVVLNEIAKDPEAWGQKEIIKALRADQERAVKHRR